MLGICAVGLAWFGASLVVASHQAAQGPLWRQVGLSGVTIHALAVSRARAGPTFVGAEPGVYRQDRGGAWRRVLTIQGVWDVYLLPDDRTVIAGDNSGSVDVSHDGGQRWLRRFVTAQGVYAVTSRPDRPSWILAGAGGGIFLSRDGGAHWQRRLALAGSGVDVLVWRPGSTRVVLAGSVAGAAGARTGAYISRDGGMTWRSFGRGLGSPAGIMSLAVTDRSGVLAGTMGNAVWRAAGPGKAWRASAAGMPRGEDHVAGLAIIPGSPPTLFAATLGSGVFRSVDGGARWSAASAGLSAARNATIVLSLRYAPSRRWLYAGTADGVYALNLGGVRSGRG